MDRLAGGPNRNSLLQRLIIVAFLVGILSAIALSVARDYDRLLALPLAAAVAFLVYIVTFIDLTLGLAILIACIGLSPELAVGGLDDIRLEDFVAPALVLAWTLRAYDRRETIAPALVTGPLILFSVVILISTVGGLGADSTTPRMALLFIGKSVEYFLIYFLFLNAITTRQQFRAITAFTLIVAVAASLQATGSMAIDNPLGTATRLTGPVGESANIFGGYLILHMAVAGGIYLQARTGAIRLMAAGALIFLGVPLLFTYSRTSFAALMFAMLAFGALKDRRLILILFAVGALLPFMAPEGMWQRITSILGVVSVGPEPSSWLSRIDAWMEASERVFATSPLLGFGMGSVRLGQVDSEYIRVLVDTGVLGLALFVWIQWRLVQRANDLYLATPEASLEKGFAGGYWIALMAMLIHAVAATSFTSIRTMESFMVLTGLFAALHHRWRSWQPRTEEEKRVLIESAPVLEPRI